MTAGQVASEASATGQAGEESDLFEDLDVLAEEPYAGTGASQPEVHTNTGQVAASVHGGMHQYTNDYFSQQMRQFREYHELTRDYVRRVMETFVEREYRCAAGDAAPALDSAAAATLFARCSCLVLVGDPGAGRHTAAVALLSRLNLPMQEIRADYDPAQPRPLNVADLPAESGQALLLELPAHREWIRDDFARQLAAYREKLRGVASYLVVIATGEIWSVIGGCWDGGVLTVESPDPREILLRQLSPLAARLDLNRLMNASAIVTKITGLASPRQAARLAELVSRATAAQPAGPLDVDTVVATATAAYDNWDSELADWFRQNPQVRRRLFLLATALLEGAPAGVVLRAAEDLGDRLDDGPPTGAGIAEAGIRELAIDVGARIAADGTISFNRPEYATAVLGFIRSDRSDRFARHLRGWATELPMRDRSGSSRRVAERIAEVMLRMCLRGRDSWMVRADVLRWASRRDLRPVLIEMLTVLALSPQVGSWIRQQLNLWAWQSNRVEVLCTVAELCQGQLADVYPEVALTRLNHLAGKELPAVADSVVGAVTGMWRRPALRAPVVRKISAWMGEGAGPRFEVGYRILAELAGADADTGSDVGSGSGPDAGPPAGLLQFAIACRPRYWDDLVQALVPVFERPLSTDMREACFGWLALAAADRATGDGLIDLLVCVIRSNAVAARRIVHISSLAHTWHSVAGESIAPDRQAFQERLIQRLHRADPLIAPLLTGTDSTSTRSPEEATP